MVRGIGSLLLAVPRFAFAVDPRIVAPGTVVLLPTRRAAALDLGEGLAPLEAAAAEAAGVLRAFCDAEESALEEVAAALPGAAQEAVAARLVALRDAAWSLDAEFLGMLARARDLAGP